MKLGNADQLRMGTNSGFLRTDLFHQPDEINFKSRYQDFGFSPSVFIPCPSVAEPSDLLNTSGYGTTTRSFCG